MATGRFWHQDCPARGAGLLHGHSSSCRHIHTTPIHFADQCCDCLQRESEWKPIEAVAAVPPSLIEHKFIFTMAGPCGFEGCGKMEDDHALFVEPDPITGCTVDHASIKTALLIGDGGLEWTRCPICGYHVEPAMPEDARSIKYKRPYGAGRLPFTRRHWADMEKLKRAFEGGYYKS